MSTWRVPEWAAGRIVNTKRGLLFLLQRGVAWFYLPNRAFEGNDYRERILALAAAQGVSIEES